MNSHVGFMTNDAVLSAPSERTARDTFWMRIASDLAESIASGLYGPGQRLPTERTLAEQFGVNRHTIRRSLASLCSQGLLRSTQGSGTYVEDFAVDLVLSKRTRHSQNLELVGRRGGLTVLSAETLSAPAHVASRLKLNSKQKVLRLDVLGEADGHALSVSERFFPAQRFPRLEEVVRATGSITEAFAAHGLSDYTRQESRITAEMPSAALAVQLKQSPQRPVLRVESLNVDCEGVPIESAVAWFPSDRVSLTVAHLSEDTP